MAAAAECMEAALALDPSRKEALKTLAYARHLLGDWEGARKGYEAWAKASPAEAAEAYIGLGAVLAGRGRMEEAAQAFKNASKADPKNFRAKIYAELSRVDKAPVSASAKQSLRAGRKESRESGRKAYQQGLELQKAGDLGGAMKKWEEALAKNPDDREVRKAYDMLSASLQAKAEAYVKAGEKLEEAEAYEDARAAYEKALANDPDNVAAAKNLLNLQSSRRRSAEKHMKRAQGLSAKGRLQEAATEYQVALSFQDDPTARASLRKTLRDIRTENLRLLYLAGQAVEKEDLEEARGLLAQALDLEPSLRPLEVELPSADRASKSPDRAARARHQEMYLDGLSDYVSGDLEGALKTWNRILRENPRHGAAREGVAKAENELKFLMKRSGPK
jgi:tetratricopeptide (TPR) repeat protein